MSRGNGRSSYYRPEWTRAVATVLLALGSVVMIASPAGAVPSWKITARPVPKGSPEVTLDAVSCPSATFCVAVGNRAAARSLTSKTLAERWNGERWSIMPTPNLGGAWGSVLNGVSCPSVTFCVAVGSSSSASKYHNSKPLVEQWSGSGWSIATSPDPGGSGSAALNGVSCPSTGSCFAVGFGNGGTLIEQWSGSGWSIAASPNPGGSEFAALNGVSCPSTERCVAVGSWSHQNPLSETLAERWDGERWSITSIPNGGALFNDLAGVSCPTPYSCFAVGSGTSALPMSGSVDPLTERWDGERWSIVASPTPVYNNHAFLNGVSCPSRNSCFAVGTSGLAGGSFRYLQPLVERWDGTRWSVVLSTNVSHSSDAELAGVSCASEADCFAVGNSLTGGGSRPLIEHGPPPVLPALASNRPIVGMAATRSGRGYWRVASDGGIFTFGDAHFYGSTGAITLNRPIVGMAPTPSGHGYWLVASDGGIFTFGDAHFYGSTGAITLNRPIVGMAPTPSGHGYWLVASDGGIFTFGDAHFHGSTGAITLNRPIVGMAPTPSGHGYWLVASDGGIFTFGDAHFYGSNSTTSLNASIIGMALTPPGQSGYWLAASDGSIFGFGDARFYGTSGTTNQPIVGMAVPPRGPNHWLVASDGTISGF